MVPYLFRHGSLEGVTGLSFLYTDPLASGPRWVILSATSSPHWPHQRNNVQLHDGAFNSSVKETSTMANLPDGAVHSIAF